MNRAKINEIRATLNLPALEANPTRDAKAKRRLRNLAARAAESRALKAKRTGNKKG